MTGFRQATCGVGQRLMLSVCCVFVMSGGMVRSQDQVNSGGGEQAAVTFAKMGSDQVRSELLGWLASTGQDGELLGKVTQVWADNSAIAQLSGEELLDLVVQ